MLYIRQYDKFNLDKSSINQYNYYRTKFNDLSIDIDALLAELQSLLDTIQVLRQQLNDNKDMLYDILNATKSVFAQAKVSADSTFDYIENLLDNAEQALDSLEENINNTIQEILDGCSQPNTCADEIEDVNSEEVLEEIVNEEDVDCSEGCAYCSFTVTDGDCAEEISCMLCQFDDCNVDRRCGEEGEMWSAPTNNCTYTEVSTTDPTCNQVYTTTIDYLCGEITCDLDNIHVDSLPENCSFNCTHYSDCVESSMPDSCTYSCDDGGCVYGGGSDCTYTSNGNEVDDDCGEEIVECTLYGNECFETECGEACGNCGQDCSEDCGDCGDSWCGEDDTGCSEDDCCVYSGGSQSEGDDDCGEDCGDCCVYG